MKVLKTISNYGKKIIVLLGMAAFMLSIFMAESYTAEAHVLDENVRPIGRFASVLASDRVIGVPGMYVGIMDNEATADILMKQLSDMHVDTITLGLGDYCYILLEMSRAGAIPFKPSYDDYGEMNNVVNNHRIDIALKSAHKYGIQVLFSTQVTQTNYACAKEYYGMDVTPGKFLQKNFNGGWTGSWKLDWGIPDARKMLQDMYIFMVTNHAYDGIWLEEPHAWWSISYEGDLAAENALVNWNGVNETGVKAEHGYDPRQAYIANGNKLLKTQIADMMHEQRKSFTQGFKELRERVTALGPNYIYPDFIIATGLNTGSVSSTSAETKYTNILGHNGMMRNIDMTELSKNHYIDLFLTEVCDEASSEHVLEACTLDNAQGAPEILHAEIVYITGGNTNFLDDISKMTSWGATNEAFFRYGSVDRYATYKGASYKISDWLKQNCPANPRKYIPVRIRESSPILGSCDSAISTPTFSPSPDITYTIIPNISISTSTEGDTIRYTKDDVAPLVPADPLETSTKYTAPINVSVTTAFKAKAWKDSKASAIATATYNICVPDCAVTFTSISVSPSSTSVLVNGTQSLSAIAKDQFNNPMTGIAFTWTSSNPSVATVNSSGLVTGKILGSATITALSGSLSATAAITVSATATAPTPTCTDNKQNGDETGKDCGGSCPACHLPPPPTPCDGIVCDNPGSCQVGPGKCEATSSAAYVCVYPDDPAYCDDLDGKVCTVDRCLSKDGGLTSSCSTGPDACKGLIPCGRLVDDPTTTNIIESNPCTLCAMIYMVQMIIEFLVKIAAVLAMLSITFGGFLYIFAAGNQGTLEKAKSIIKYVLIGFIIILIAWAVIDSILAAAGYIDPIGGEWYMMNC